MDVFVEKTNLSDISKSSEITCLRPEKIHSRADHKGKSHRGKSFSKQPHQKEVIPPVSEDYVRTIHKGRQIFTPYRGQHHLSMVSRVHHNAFV